MNGLFEARNTTQNTFLTCILSVSTVEKGVLRTPEGSFHKHDPEAALDKPDSVDAAEDTGTFAAAGEFR